MTNTVLILGANSLQLPIINKANELGYQTVAVSPVVTEPGHAIATYSENCDVVDEEGVLALAKKYDICGILTDQTDLPVRTMAYVANKLGLPGNDYEVARIFTDKYLMHEKCKELGIKTLNYKLCHTFQEAEEFYRSIGKDIIVKPVDNQGSKGVGKVTSLDELRVKFEEAMAYSRSASVLVEEFIVGQEFLVEGICVNYKFRNLACGDNTNFSIPDVFSATKREFPSTAPKEVVEKILATNEKFVLGSGLKQGLTHTEIVWDGKDAILFEIAARGAGAYVASDLIHWQTGIEMEEFVLGVYTGKIDKIPDFSWQHKSSCYISFFLPEGKVVKVEGLDEVISLPYTNHNNYDTLFVGKEIKKNTDKTSRFIIAFEAKDHEELMHRREDIIRMIKVDVVGADGIVKGPIWE